MRRDKRLWWYWYKVLRPRRLALIGGPGGGIAGSLDFTISANSQYIAVIAF